MTHGGARLLFVSLKLWRLIAGEGKKEMSDEVWTIKAALDWCRGYLERKGDENPRLSAEWLLCETCRMRRVELYVNFERPLSADERATLRDWVVRRGAGEPLQYITGEVAFRHIGVKVRPGVLLPRPATEVLVSEALALLPAPERRCAVDSTITQAEFEELQAEAAEKAASAAVGKSEQRLGAAFYLDGNEVSNAAADADAQPMVERANVAGPRVADGDEPGPKHDVASDVLYVADICTGSGCIACSIAYENPRTRVLACDIAPEAIALAKENVAALGLDKRVAVLQGDLGAPVGGRFMGKLSLVVSNPPYIPTNVLEGLSAEVTQHEPSLALDGGADGLDLYRPLAEWALRALAPGGGFAVELHETCLDAAADIARGLGYVDVRIVNDLADRPRVLAARKPR